MYSIRHLTVIIVFILIMVALWTYHQTHVKDISCFTQYGYWCFLLYFIRLLDVYVSFEWSLYNAAGILGFELFADKRKLHNSIISSKNINDIHLVFRVVTKGLYPSLVKTTLMKNQAILYNIGLKHYTIEIVTDQELDIESNQYVQQVVVPKEYATSNGSLFKARALQYCLEPQIDRLCEDDWIIHLDEESLLTESCVFGILELIWKGEESIGQGVITYANEEIVNWITTLSDLKRIGEDFGIQRLYMKSLQSSPCLKGSFLVVKSSAERDISFDFKPSDCIAEDLCFCNAALSKRYKIGFIEGEMWEKSTFTIADFIQQRSRWYKGIVCHCLGGPLGNLLLHAKRVISVLFFLPNIIIHFFCPLYFPHYILLPMVFVISIKILLSVVGAFKSFPVDRLGYVKVVFLYVAAGLIVPIEVFLEAVGAVAGLISFNLLEFYIVDKNLDNALTHKRNM